MNAERITEEVGKAFRCFGGGNTALNNPISHALKDKPLQFAAGPSVREVVEFVLFLHPLTDEEAAAMTKVGENL